MSSTLVIQHRGDSDFILLNDGSPTQVDDSTGTRSFLDLSLVSSIISAKCLWHTTDNWLGSDLSYLH